MQQFANKLWYSSSPSVAIWLLQRLLWPLSVLFALLTSFRRTLFRLELCKSEQLSKPVIIVGNISVGGSGKTPMVIYLIELLRRHGYNPGVISRGYGVKFDGVKVVRQGMRAKEVGDEPAMIVNRTSAPMVIGSDRVLAGKTLIELGVDIVISDDGLQHYRLARDIELLLVDGERQFGNGSLLPAGPLREGVWRAEQVDFIIENGSTAQDVKTESRGLERFDNCVSMTLAPSEPCLVQTAKSSVIADSAMAESEQTCQPLDKHTPVVAIAGIGNPNRFFDTLSELEYCLERTVPFEDHYPYSAAELNDIALDHPLIMTEKDAVKCRDFASENWWYLPVNAKLPTQFEQQLLKKVTEQVNIKS